MAEMAPVAQSDDALVALGAIDRTDGDSAVYAAMLAFAAACLERDMTQTAADTLAYLLQDAGASATVRDEAAEIFAELESRICPRVILDARSFADGMDFATMLAYLLDVIQSETT